MQLFDLELFFNPLRIAFLIFWFYLCMYLVRRFEFSPIIPKRLKASMNVLMLVFGPFVLFVFVIAEAVGKIQRYGMSFLEAVKRALGKAFEMADFSHLAEAHEATALTLLDALGRNLLEVCSNDKNNPDCKYDFQYTLKHTHDIIAAAVEQLASDIVFDPASSVHYAVQYKIDGALRTVEELDFKRCMPIVNGIKALAGMDTAEHHPQNGAFIARSAEGDISFRAASTGVLNGERLSIRILRQAAAWLTLAGIGMDEKYQQLIREKITHKSGLLLVCGPADSGKTTTVYAMLRELDLAARKAVTIEDPIEYVLPNVSQIEVDTKAGRAVAKTLQGILEQNPDVLFIGEIKDKETASLALEASQSGHLVFATLNSSSHSSAIIRLVEFGVKPLLISSAIDMFISQRLVRKLCPQCKVIMNLDEEQLERLKGVDVDKVMQPTGCVHCGQTGYKGRTAVFDIMVHSDDARAKLLLSGFAVSKFEDASDERYKANMKKQAMKLVLESITSLEEVKKMISDVG